MNELTDPKSSLTRHWVTFASTSGSQATSTTLEIPGKTREQAGDADGQAERMKYSRNGFDDRERRCALPLPCVMTWLVIGTIAKKN